MSKLSTTKSYYSTANTVKGLVNLLDSNINSNEQVIIFKHPSDKVKTSVIERIMKRLEVNNDIETLHSPFGSNFLDGFVLRDKLIAFLVDPATNPYLAMAVLLAAELDKVENKLTPPSPIDRNIYAMDKAERIKNGIKDLLMSALQELKADEVIKEALGDHQYEPFIEAKEIEWDKFRKSVHPWEREQYLTSL